MGTTKRGAKPTFGSVLGKKLRAARENLGLSQLEVARRVGMRPPKLCELELGRSPRGPAPQTLAKLADVLKLPLSDLLHV